MNAAEESVTVDYLLSDTQTLVHEWFTEPGIPWSQKSYSEQVTEIDLARH
jgi:hypothetical protein